MRIKVLLSIFVCLCLGFGIIYFKQDDKKEKKEVVNTNYQTVVFKDKQRPNKNYHTHTHRYNI